MSAQKIEIEAIVYGSQSKVWAYWTTPEHITKWNFASPDWCCPSATNDLKVGGKYFARMEACDGSFGFDFEAIYDEVSHETKMAYTMPDGRKVVTHFNQVGTGTKVSTVFDAENENSVELQKSGWQAILNNFKKYVENN